MNEPSRKKPTRVLFLVPYPLGQAPSQRFRFEQYFDALKDHGIEYRVQSFMGYSTWRILYLKGQWLRKMAAVLTGYMRRYAALFTLPWYDFVFIHREVTPVGPPIYAWILAKVLRKKIIYDFDDAIWIKNYSEGNRIFSVFKLYSNAMRLMTWSYRNSCGNEYLRRIASIYNPHSFLIPTTVNTRLTHNQVRQARAEQFPVLGWTGSHSTLHYLRDLQPILNKLRKRFEFTTIVISDLAPDFTLPGMEFIPWKRETEISDLLRMDIGLMPLKPDRWSEGKCGLKIIQYMALGIVPVAAPVGVNMDMVEDGINGFLCATEQEWMEKLELLFVDGALRQRLASRTRQKVEQQYSAQSQEEQFLRLFALEGTP